MAKRKQNPLLGPFLRLGRSSPRDVYGRSPLAPQNVRAGRGRAGRKRKTIRYKGVSIIPVGDGEYTVSIDRDSRFDSVKDARDMIRAFKRSNPSAFDKCVADVEARGGARDPRAVCAAAGRKKYGQAEMTRRAKAGHKKAARRRGRGNPEEGSAKLFEKFHQTPSTKVKEFEVKEHEHSWLAELGRLVYLVVKVGANQGKLLDGFKGVEVAAAEDGGQIYFIGGDAALDLRDFPGLSKTLPKDHVELGPCVEICYHTKKGFHKFEPTDYHHKFGKPDGFPPILNYDVLNERPYLSGGTYQVKREGIVN